MAKSRASTAAEPFKVGDTVVLKSGGPAMTVIKVEDSLQSRDHARVTTTWFAGKKNERGAFPPAALVREDAVKKEKKGDDDGE